MSTRIPRVDPNIRYVFLQGGNKLLPDSLLSSCFTDTFELTLVFERLPWRLSAEPSDKSGNVEILGDDGTSARRASGGGGVVISERSVPWKEGPDGSIETGEFTFEVVIDGMAGDWHEGVEVGVTTSRPTS